MEEISIGEFARRSRLSVKALRLYDELGVVNPARVARNTGYRYYDVAQLEAARLVAMSRQLDLPLAAIKELLACDPLDAAEQIAIAHNVMAVVAWLMEHRLDLRLEGCGDELSSRPKHNFPS